MGTNYIDVACSYVPVEIIHAAGFIPRRLIPPAPGEAALLPRNFCSYARACVTTADRAVPAVFTTCCDGLRRCYDVRKEQGDMVFILDLPRQAKDSAVRHYRQELIRMGEWLAEISGRPVPAGALRDSFRVYQEVRRQLKTVERFDGINGKFWELLWAALTGPPEDALKLGTEFQAGFAPDGQKKRRVLLAGTVLPDPRILELAEQYCTVVAFADFCLGGRFYPDFSYPSREGPSSDDPWLALAGTYLAKPPCPRMAGKSGRAPYIQNILESVRPAGVIFYGLKFCDHGLYEVPLWRLFCGRREIPFLHLEGEYQSGVPAQLHTRLQAFLETI
ncbi:MAG: 2-hydroxyacyl-CoA dehydratase family protein [Armatimonadetes bacterium]|nr:2-hydroxyacyl-CoA dehydratase family protein [Armatimonadota bacterium]